MRAGENGAAFDRLQAGLLNFGVRNIMGGIEELTRALVADWFKAAREGKAPVVCICGSTRFAEKMNEVGAWFTLRGWIVVRPEVVTYSSANDPQKVAPDVKARLDELHKRKIDMADLVFVVNQEKYIGPSTQSELQYARKHGKLIEFLEPAVIAKGLLEEF